MSLLLRNSLVALGITVLIIGTIAYAVNYLDRLRVDELQAIQTQLAIDTLSLETQFSLLENASCETVAEGTTLSQELSDLGDRLSFTETRLGADNPEVLRLKEQYTLLQIRDYLLSKRLSEACAFDPVVVLYFYSNEVGACTECDRAGYALSYLRQQYPKIRVYSFDYNLKLGALDTLIAVEKVQSNFPAFVIEGKHSYGFSTIEELQAQFPKSAFATSTPSTKK